MAKSSVFWLTVPTMKGKETSHCKVLAKRLKAPLEVTAVEEDYLAQKTELVSYFPELDHVNLHMRLKSEIRQRMLAQAGQKRAHDMEIKNLRWTLTHLEDILETEVFLQVPKAIVAVKIGKECSVALWVRCQRILEVPVSLTFVQMFLTDTAFQGRRFRNGHLDIVGKYDRRATFDETTFYKVRKVSDGWWEVQDNNGKVVQVEASWGTNPENMSLENQRKVVEQYNLDVAAGLEPQFKQIDEGARKNSVTSPPDCSKGTSSDVLPYFNGEGHHECVAAALASAVHLAGHPLTAQRIYKGIQVSKKANLNKPIRTCVISILRSLELRFEWVTNRRYRVRTIKDIHEKNVGGVLLGSLRGKRGTVNHAVAFFGDLLIDPNTNHTLPITSETLNAACGGNGFNGLGWAIRIHLENLK